MHPASSYFRDFSRAAVNPGIHDPPPVEALEVLAVTSMSGLMIAKSATNAQEQASTVLLATDLETRQIAPRDSRLTDPQLQLLSPKFC